ncbi:Subtilisin-like protease 3, partial [Linum perenne]
ENSSGTYIVFVKKPQGVLFEYEEDLDRWYQSFLPSTIASSGQQQQLVRSYRNVVTGFAARVTAAEVKDMEAKEGFVSAWPDRTLHVHTTHTPDFLGLRQNYGFWSYSNYGEGVIIGVIDTGVIPNHPSFSDEGMPTPPAKWKGRCEFNSSVCNNKLIGARNYVPTVSQPFDDNGHGTHTASTAAGSPVEGASFYGQLNGTAVGIAPKAHLAVYKACSRLGKCKESDVLAAMDAAVEDGVDVLSLSIGYGSLPFHQSPAAIGAFGAMQKGVFVTCSAGNRGPRISSLSNEAPWILTVGASIDGSASSAICQSLEEFDVKGKVVLCDTYSAAEAVKQGQAVKDAGGAAMVLISDSYITIPQFHVLPASSISFDAGNVIKNYIKSSPSPMATITFKGTVFGLSYSPQVAVFSSRGPSAASPGILKPDILGPGPDEYIPYLCGLGYSNSSVEIIVQRKVKCSRNSSIPEAQLNYPSFSIRMSSTQQTYTRTVTNVGPANSSYKSEILGLQGVDVKATPATISFTELNQKVSFSVTFSRKESFTGPSSQGHLRWFSSSHNVTIPIAVELEFQ